MKPVPRVDWKHWYVILTKLRKFSMNVLFSIDFQCRFYVFLYLNLLNFVKITYACEDAERYVRCVLQCFETIRGTGFIYDREWTSITPFIIYGLNSEWEFSWCSHAKLVSETLSTNWVQYHLSLFNNNLFNICMNVNIYENW